MALVHEVQDSPRAASTKGSRHDLVQVSLLFANLWGLLVGLPLGLQPRTSLWAWVVGCLPCALFVLGLLQESRKGSRLPRAPRDDETFAGRPPSQAEQLGHGLGASFSALCWLVGVPLSLSFSVGLNRHSVLDWGLPGVLLCALSLCGYGAAALVQTVPTTPLEKTRVLPLPSPTAPPPPPPRRWRGWWRPLLFATGGLSLGIVSPYLAASHAEANLGTNGHVWALLAAVVGGGLGATCTGWFLGSALTAASPVSGRRPPTIAPYLILSALGAATYYLIALKS